MKTGQPTHLTLEKTLAKIRKQFAQEARKSWSSAFVLHEKLRSCIEMGRDSRRFNRAYQLLQGGLNEWRNDLERLTEVYFRILLDIAFARRDWISDDPVQWARDQISGILTEEFERGAEIEDKQWVGPVPLVDLAELKSKPARHLDWFRRACDGLPDITREGSGWPEPWCAPRWIMGRQNDIVGWMRLTVEQTNTSLWHARISFTRRLNSVLEAAVDTALIDMARKPQHRRASSETKGALNYRSALKRAILTELIKDPSANSLKICRRIDEAESAEWSPQIRLLEDAYRNSADKPKVESMISKVRAEMRKCGLLKP